MMKIEIEGNPPYEDSEYGRKYRADAFVLLECMGPHCVDAVVTDPPYGLNIDNQAWDDGDIHIDWLAYQFGRVTKPKGNVFVFCSDFQFGAWYQELGKYFSRLQKFVWCKTNPVERQFKKLNRFAESVEFALHASNPNSYFKLDKEEGIQNYIKTGICSGNERVKKSDGKSMHPTQKPMEVMKYILEAITDEGDVILDPFAGTHTTARAAAALERYYITNDAFPYYWWMPED
ncbi:MAG: site-specific DNA-methyltransferase [Pseudodesulfovibrio sp.]|nr:site-specific DNA-methyltransferase [Pseudodesulfovibrio sp.]